MYDTIGFWVCRGDIRGDPFKVLNFLSDVTERQNENKGYSAFGHIGNYRVCCFQTGISLQGSLAKYLFGTNASTLTRKATGEAIEKLSDDLSIDLGKYGKINRLDIGNNIAVKNSPTSYFSLLGDKNHFERLQESKHTLYYQNKKRKLIFYDKGKEIEAKKADLPPTLASLNLLRYEYSILNSVQRQLKTDSQIMGNMLTKEDFYYNVIQIWANEFKTIKKNNIICNMSNEIKTPQEAQTALFSMLLQQGGQSLIDNYIGDLKAKQAFADPKYYSRLKSNLNKLIQGNTTGKNEMLQEIETAILNFAKYAR